MDVDELLQAYARNVAFEMGKDTTTTTSELNDYGRRHFSAMQFLGVYPANETPARTEHRCFYVQNVDPSSKPGSHWLAVARQPGERDLLFDTFARAPSANFIPHMRGMALTEPDVDQEAHTTRCGQLCMGFGHVFINHGYDAAKMC